MSTISYTPGPWCFDTDKKGYGCEFSGYAVHSDRYTVATVVTDTESLANAANARLIAAAPELLEALQALRLAREQNEYPSWEKGVPEFAKAEALADAAIAKAIGE